jgi:hypothetical protein
VKSGYYRNFYFDIHEKIKKRFDSEGINTPFPQQDEHLFQKREKIGMDFWWPTGVWRLPFLPVHMFKVAPIQM